MGMVSVRFMSVSALSLLKQPATENWLWTYIDLDEVEKDI